MGQWSMQAPQRMQAGSSTARAPVRVWSSITRIPIPQFRGHDPQGVSPTVSGSNRIRSGAQLPTKE